MQPQDKFYELPELVKREFDFEIHKTFHMCKTGRYFHLKSAAAHTAESFYVHD